MNYRRLTQPMWLNAPRPCGGCGDVHHYNFCKAKNRICYKCRNYGHYAQFCNRTSISQSSSTNQARTQSSTGCHQEVEYICTLMPFYNVEDLAEYNASVDLNDRIIMLEAEADSRKDIINSLEKDICNLNCLIQEKDNLINPLDPEIQITKSKFQKIMDCAKMELESLASEFVYLDADEDEDDPSGELSDFYCQQCGSHHPHDPDECPASLFCITGNEKCGFCDNSGHFTLMCKDLMKYI